MKLSIDFGRWTTTKAALAVAGVLAIGGAVGTALAISPTIAPPIKWAGGVNIEREFIGAGGVRLAYTVPAGQNFMLTDIVISNAGANPAENQVVTRGIGSNCESLGTFRTTRMVVPPGDTLHLPLVTGIGFSAGQLVCLWNGDEDGSVTSWALRGFLFTAAPAS